METGLSNLAFPRLNLSSIRSCDREEVDLEGKEQKAELKFNNVIARTEGHFYKYHWVHYVYVRSFVYL